MQDVERRSLVYETESASQPLLRVERRCEPAADGQERERDWIVGYAAKFGVNSANSSSGSTPGRLAW
jgi:hypothetical protein